MKSVAFTNGRLAGDGQDGKSWGFPFHNSLSKSRPKGNGDLQWPVSVQFWADRVVTPSPLPKSGVRALSDAERAAAYRARRKAELEATGRAPVVRAREAGEPATMDGRSGAGWSVCGPDQLGATPE